MRVGINVIEAQLYRSEIWKKAVKAQVRITLNFFYYLKNKFH